MTGRDAIPARSGERGLALMSVLWTVVILALVVGAVASSGAVSYRMQRNAQQWAEASALADAGIARAILSLLDRRGEQRWRIDGVARAFSLGGAPVAIRIQDEGGLINLNGADGDLLAALFVSAGLAADRAQTLANNILDWRSTGDQQRWGVPTSADYGAIGSYGPRHGPFQSVDELRLVIGMTSDLFAKVEPALSVYSRRRLVDRRWAPKEVTAALAVFDANQPPDAERLFDPTDGGEGLSLSGIDQTPSLAERIFRISAEVSSASVPREAVVMITGDVRRPYLVLSWR